MKVTPTAIADVLVIEPKVFGDARGFFFESFNQKAFDEATGHAMSTSCRTTIRAQRKGVLRGLHYQIQQPQGKLVRVVRGAVFDVAVDIRKLADLRPVGRRGAERREPPAAVGAAGVCARLSGAQRVGGVPLQDHRLLRAAA